MKTLALLSYFPTYICYIKHRQKTKWRNLEKDEFKRTFLPKALEIVASVTPEMNYEELEAYLLQLAKEELGETSGGG